MYLYDTTTVISINSYLTAVLFKFIGEILIDPDDTHIIFVLTIDILTPKYKIELSNLISDNDKSDGISGTFMLHQRSTIPRLVLFLTHAIIKS